MKRFLQRRVLPLLCCLSLTVGLFSYQPPKAKAVAVADDLRVCVTPEEQVCHEGFSEHKGTHFGVRLIMQKQVQRMIDGLFLAAVLCVSIYM